MFVHDTRLPHLLAPACYHDPAWYERELERVFRPAWHCVATLDQLRSDGDVITCELLGVGVLLRRGGGRVHAFRNACAHRFSALCHQPHAHMPTLRCPYHGWTYADDGTLTDVPDADSFRSPPGKTALIGRVKLSALPLACVGQLVFVSLAADPPPIEQTLDARTLTLARACTSPDHQLIFARTLAHPCNWKIPLENVLETYHVNELHRNWLARHPRVLRVFGDDAPGEHELAPAFSEYRDRMGASLAPYRQLVRLLAGDVPCSYRQHHAFPNLVVAETPILGFVQVVTPCGPTHATSLVRLYLRRGPHPRLSAPLRALVAAAASRFLDMVLREDAAIYESVQIGVQSSDRPGTLGAREERVHAMQRWLHARVTDP